MAVTLAGETVIDGQGSLALHQPHRTLIVPKLAVRLSDPKPILAALPVAWRGGLNVATVEGRITADGRAVLELTPPRWLDGSVAVQADGLAADLPIELGRVTNGSLSAELVPGRLTLKSAAFTLGDLAATISAVAETDPHFDLLGRPVRVRDVSARIRSPRGEGLRLSAHTEFALGLTGLTVEAATLWFDVGTLWAELPPVVRQRLPPGVVAELDRRVLSGTAQLDGGAKLSWADGRFTVPAVGAQFRSAGLGVDLGAELGRLDGGEIAATVSMDRLAITSARFRMLPTAGEPPLTATLRATAEFARGLDLSAPIRVTGISAQVLKTMAAEPEEVLLLEADAEWRPAESRLRLNARRAETELGPLWLGIPADWRNRLAPELAGINPAGRLAVTGSASLDIEGVQLLHDAELKLSLRGGAADLAGLLPGGGQLRGGTLVALIHPDRVRLDQLFLEHHPPVGNASRPMMARLSGQAELDLVGSWGKARPSDRAARRAGPPGRPTHSSERPWCPSGPSPR